MESYRTPDIYHFACSLLQRVRVAALLRLQVVHDAAGLCTVVTKEGDSFTASLPLTTEFEGQSETRCEPTVSYVLLKRPVEIDISESGASK